MKDAPYLLAKTSSRLICRTLWRIRASGAGNIPASGPAVLLANHASYIDPFFLGVCMNRPVRFMEWDALFSVPGVGLASRMFGSFPVNQEKPDRSALRKAGALLSSGEIVGVFPEGSRTIDGLIHNMASGGVRIAMRSGAPIVPASIAGSERVWQKGRILFRPGPKILVRFHEPLAPPQDRAQIPVFLEKLREIINSSVMEMESEIRVRGL